MSSIEVPASPVSPKKRGRPRKSVEPLVVPSESDPTQDTPRKVCPFSTSELADKIVSLAEIVAGMKYYPYQRDPAIAVCTSILDNEAAEVTLCCARQVGKTVVLASLSAALVTLLPELARMFPDDSRLNRLDDHGTYRGFKNGFRIGLFAPIKEQADIAYSRVRAYFERDEAAEVLKQLNLGYLKANGNTVQLTNGSSVKALSASENSKIEGHTFDFLILEEGQDISTLKISKSLRPTIASTNGTILYCGSAAPQRNDFYEAIQRNRRKEALGAKRQHFEYNYEYCQKYNTLYGKFVEGERQRLGEFSDAFRMSYKVEWILERGMFTTPESLKTLEINEKNWESYCNDSKFYKLYHTVVHGAWDNPGSTLVAGVDFGKNHDSTVVTILDVDSKHPIFKQSSSSVETFVEYMCFRKAIIGWLEIYGDNYESQYFQIKEYLNKFQGLKRIVLDATGVGESQTDRFITTFEDIEVIGFKYSLQSKSEAYKLLASDFSARRITYPGSTLAQATTEYKKFITQFLDLEKNYNGEHMVCRAPEKKDAHDDYPCSLVLANYGTQTPLETGVEVSNLNLFK